MSAGVTVSFIVPAGYQLGDYAKLVGNSGSGEVDYDSPLTGRRMELFPNGAGLHGLGHAPVGCHRCGRGHSINTAGCGHLPLGKAPCGHGSAEISDTVQIDSCGTYKFAWAGYDPLGNAHDGNPEEVELTIHTARPAPAKLSKDTYDPAADILTLSAP